jgi:predicted RNase H-like HicB family nuclease
LVASEIFLPDPKGIVAMKNIGSSQQTYLGIVTQTIDGYCVCYPDIPGHICPGTSFRDASRNAEGALIEHLRIRHDDAAHGPEGSDYLGSACPSGRQVGRILVAVPAPLVLDGDDAPPPERPSAMTRWARWLGRFAARRRLVMLALPLLFAAPLLHANVSRTDNFEARALAAHNRVRAEVGVAPLVWDQRLAGDAAIWALHLERLGHLVHLPDDDDADPEGENLWAGTRGHYPVEAMVGLWAAEKSDFKPGIFPLNSRSGDVDRVGHYTQMIWGSTRKVGCALAEGRVDEFMVCRYAEGGNVLGEKPF